LILKHEHLQHLQRATEQHRTALDQSEIVARGHNASFGALNRVDEVLCRALDHARETREALKAGDKEGALEHSRHLHRFLSTLSDELGTLHEKHDVAATAHRGVRHAVKKAAAHVRSVLDDSDNEDEVLDMTAQTSDGHSDGASDGTSPPRSTISYAERKRELKRLGQIGEQQKHDWSVTRGSR
jgi:hypothetical protein